MGAHGFRGPARRIECELLIVIDEGFLMFDGLFVMIDEVFAAIDEVFAAVDELKGDKLGIVGWLNTDLGTFRYTIKLPISLVYPSRRYFLLIFSGLVKFFFLLFFLTIIRLRDEFLINCS